MGKKINENSTLEEVLSFKGAEAILKENGFPCVTCPMAKMEMGILKIGEVCDNYNVDKKELLKKLNDSLKS